MRFYTRFVILCLALLCASCAEIVVKQVDYAAAPDIPRDAHPTPIMFSKLRFLLPPGTEIGLESGMGPALLGGVCSWSNYPVNRRVLSSKFESQYLQATFEDALESQGYDVTNDVELDFDRDDAVARAEYFISAKVRDIDLDLCKRGRITSFNIFNTAPGAKGKIWARFDWTVYDALQRKVIYQTSTEGYSRRDYPNEEGLELLFMDAFDMASHNLGADQGFYNLIIEGKKPKKVRASHFDRDDPVYDPHFDPMEKVRIDALPLRSDDFTSVAEQKRKVAVTLQKRGHGSGFFITKEGHILSNAHVVGNSNRVRVILADKEDHFIAEVLRINKARDVALLKLIDPPDNLEVELLPIQTVWPAVSSDVFAIGTPLHYSKMDNTITKGIVSNHRKDFKYRGLLLDFIQADVNIHAGNSGGPLLDRYGNIVGISTLAYQPVDDSHGANLNLFIPIGEALDVLGIQL